MAALSAQRDLDPEALLLEDVHGLLRQHGAIVPGDELPTADKRSTRATE